MTDREKVLKGLRCIAGDVVWCAQCPYSDINGSGHGYRCKRDCVKDAIALLKAQEPRLMTLADVNNIGPEDVCAFVEIKEESHMYVCYMRQYDETHTEIMCDVPDFVAKLQGGIARIWTSRPTDEQREAVKWDEQ